MRIAVEGCGHGTLHSIYASITKSCAVNKWKGIDLLIIGGDFQAVRNAYDLNTMSVPVKYRAIGDFHEYYSGKRLAPYLTIFVGGNHEASSYLQELYYGGWVAENIYYLGAANVIRFGDLRIAGLSGIWKGYNYNKPHFERLPYNADEVKSLYHVRELDVRKLLLLRSQVDIGISHDWPRGVEWMGDHKSLFRQKDLFEADARAGTLGSSAAKYVMDRLRPPHWFAAHLHCKFAAKINYDQALKAVSKTGSELNARDHNNIKNDDEIDLDGDDITPTRIGSSAPAKNNDEIDIGVDDEGYPGSVAQTTMPTANDPTIAEVVSPPAAHIVSEEVRAQLPAAFSRPPPTPKDQLSNVPPPSDISNKTVDFLALDKCLPNRKFLQILDIEPLLGHGPSSNTPKLSYDPEWLAILRVFGDHDPHLPSPSNSGESAYIPLIQAQTAWIEEHLSGKLAVPDNFAVTAPVYDGGDIRSLGSEQPKEYTNPQTTAFCKLIGIENHFNASEEDREGRIRTKGMEIEAEARAGGKGRGSGRGRARGGRGGPSGGSRGRGRGRGFR